MTAGRNDKQRAAELLKQLDDARERRARLEGQLEAAEKALKALGHKDVASAERALKALEAKEAELETKLAAKLDELEALL